MSTASQPNQTNENAAWYPLFMTRLNKSDLMKSLPILFGSRWPASGLDDAIASVDPDALCAEYAALRNTAPRRSLAGKRYFVGHRGIASATRASNRLEEHCAIALVNLGRHWPRGDGGWFRLLDYQVPLKSRQTDAGIGKIDLLGVTDRGRLMIVELKVQAESGSRSDAPPGALMEGLRYAAIVEADLEAIGSEVQHRFGMKIARVPPIVKVLAPDRWWHGWLEPSPVGNWGPAFAHLAAAVEARTGVTIECMAFENAEIAYGLDGQAPRLDHVPLLYPVRLDRDPPIADALSPQSSDGHAMVGYLDLVYRTLWAWADRYHIGQLDGGRREGRPPVLNPAFASMNVLISPNRSHADEVGAAIRPEQRHRHFASLRSSQALAQSIFGAIAAFGRLDLLRDLTADCGRPAFFTDHRGWTLGFEHEVDTLGEPRPTSIDVLLSGPNRLVAIECKFTEAEFGTCSRPRLGSGDASYPTQRCDGNYRAQAGRNERCPLTTIGIRYWDHIPRLFAWPADRDHKPCPFGGVYQVARNALAAVVTPEGEADTARGHALVLYDARNPAFQASGRADEQWETSIAACFVPGLLRRISWQRVLTVVAAAPDLMWLVDSLRGKYGLVPDYGS